MSAIISSASGRAYSAMWHLFSKLLHAGSINLQNQYRVIFPTFAWKNVACQAEVASARCVCSSYRNYVGVQPALRAATRGIVGLHSSDIDVSCEANNILVAVLCAGDPTVLKPAMNRAVVCIIVSVCASSSNEIVTSCWNYRGVPMAVAISNRGIVCEAIT